MKEYIFSITGLSCNKCVARVTTLLTEQYPTVVATLQPSRLRILADTPVTVDDINMYLQDTGYKVHKVTMLDYVIAPMRKFLPLIIMLGITVLFGLFHMYFLELNYFWGAHYFMAGYFLLFGGLKVVNWKKFVSSYRAYDPIAKRSKVYANIYPAIEFGIGLFFYFNIFLFWTYVFTSILMLQKAYGVYKKLQTGEEVQCACLGGFFKIPVTWVTFFEDLGMAAMSIWMLSYYF